jgi:hypothetical protein
MEKTLWGKQWGKQSGGRFSRTPSRLIRMPLAFQRGAADGRPGSPQQKLGLISQAPRARLLVPFALRLRRILRLAISL